MEHLEGLLRLVDNELGAIEQNGKFRSREEIDSVYKLIDIAKDVYCIWSYEDSEDEMSYDDGMSRRSYARGRYAKRDSMGRYSREGSYRDGRYRGYSREGKMEYVEGLRDMMANAPDEQTRQELKRMIDNMA